MMHIVNTVFTEKISPSSTSTITQQPIIPSHSDPNLTTLPQQTPLPSSRPSSSPSASPTMTNPSHYLGINSDHLPHNPSIDPQPLPQSNVVSQVSAIDDQFEQLSSKLVRSIERIASLEDELHESRRRNEKLASRNAKLELQTAQHKEALEGGLLVERENVQLELQRLTHRITLESERRSQSEASLSSINQELDDLSASLFTEANRLVATEKLARIQAERKVREVEEAMARVEEVIEARRDQSNDLRLSLEAAERDRDHYTAQCEILRNQLSKCSEQNNLTPLIDSTTKSSSAVSIFNSRDSAGTSLPNHLTSTSHDHSHTSFPPCPPTPGHSYASGCPAVPRLKVSHDILPFAEFTQFLHHLRRTREEALPRPPQPPRLMEPHHPTGIVMTSIGIHPQPSNQVIQSSIKDKLSPVMPLSQHLSQPFVKRCLEEDSDPTLRLDLAPGLNFISRRPIVTALLEGNLLIEPVWSESDRSTEFEKCTLCGCSLSPWLSTRGQSVADSNQTENNTSTSSSSARSAMRKMLRGGSWGFGSIGKPKRSSNPTPSTQQAEKTVPSVSLVRTNSGPAVLNNDQADPLYVHTFRTTDAASTRYPICPTYCLARLRSVCHFWTFVRSLERGVLLDESFWFSHYINHQSTSSRFTEVQSLGLAYDSTLKSIRQQTQSMDSLHDSPSLTHSDPSSASNSAHTNPFQNHADLASSISSQNDDLMQNAKQLSSGADGQDLQARVLNGVLHQTSDFQNSGSEQARTIDMACDLLPSPLPSPTSTSGHDVDSGHEVAQSHTVTLVSATPSPPVSRRSMDRSLSSSMISFSTLVSRIKTSGECDYPSVGQDSAQGCAPKEAPFGRDTEASGGIPLTKAKDERPPDLHIPTQKSSLSAPATSSEIGRHGGGQSRDKAPASVELLEAGWEEKCWVHVVKLKEEMFIKRVGIDLPTS